MLPNFDTELDLISRGYKYIAGMDEAGRGPLAGPIVASAVILACPESMSSWLVQDPTSDSGLAPLARMTGLKDSKKLSPKQRAELAPQIYQSALSVGVGVVDATTIDSIGIGKANKLAFLLAILDLKFFPDYLLTDFLTIGTSDLILLNHRTAPRECANTFALSRGVLNNLLSHQKGIVHGDALISSISAASIIAKTHRDDLMEKMHLKYPQYGFDKHKGYGTKAHMETLKTHGPCPEHRRSFAPIYKEIPPRR